ncbi:unnamed protein product [Angiostrongylus costaricensis]|uniref:EF-hand domain-containing protein n=1 Tax=Angiostrongylus costaricensis TaxID=334426 RepID=A0A0R3PQZ2_ANGCS|nr:unnamed protein product [Angiostrongylus costaricensis]
MDTNRSNMQLALITTALCCSAFSAPVPVPLEEEFNLPGFSAMQENHEEKFLRVDQNKDKKLNFGEFLHMELAYVDAKKEEFDSLDKDGDGIITQREYEEHYRGVTNRSEARRTEYFAKVFQDFDEDFDLSLSQNELEKLLAKRFLVKPRENFPKLFYNLDNDRSGGLDLNEYMKFDATFPFDQTDPIPYDVNRVRSNGTEILSEQTVPVKATLVPNSTVDEQDVEAIAQVMGQASASFKNSVPKQAAVLQKGGSTSLFEHGFTGKSDFTTHPVKPSPFRQILPIQKIVKAVKSI